MKFDLINTAKSAASRVAFFMKDKSPELCFVGGVVSLIAAGYFVWNGKAKCEEAMKKHEERMKRIQELEEAVRKGALDPAEITPKEIKGQKRHYCMKTAVEFAKIFAPIAILTITSIGLFGKSTAIYKGRYLASAAVCTQQSKYIKQLEEQLGEDKVKELSTPVKDPDTMVILAPPLSEAPVFFFDCRSREWIDGDPEATKCNLKRLYNVANDLLRINKKGIFLNQIVKLLDLHTGTDCIIGTEQGQIYGWSMSKNPDDGADGYIDFGVDWDNTDFSQDVLIRFNCDKRPLLGRSGMSKR